MPRTCAAESCFKNFSLCEMPCHKFPKDEKLCALWSRLARPSFPTWVPTNIDRLCGYHFSDEDYIWNPKLMKSAGLSTKNMRLKPGVVPSVFSKKGSSDQLTQPLEKRSEALSAVTRFPPGCQAPLFDATDVLVKSTDTCWDTKYKAAESSVSAATPGASARGTLAPSTSPAASTLKESPRTPTGSLKATENISFRCCSCTYVTRDQRGIVNHLVDHGDEQFKCQHPLMLSCSRFQVPSNTQNHKGNKLFKSELCSQVFKDCQLSNHNGTHTGEEPFQYKLCPQVFAGNSLLKSNNQTHFVEKPYKFKLHPQAPARSFQLTSHNRTHTKEKPYECNLCPQAFLRSSELVRHNRTHTGEKPYKCKLCPQAFTKGSHLKKHNQTHIGEKPLKVQALSPKLC